jgi:hypothetical protein
MASDKDSDMKLRLTLDENTDAGRIGLELLSVRAAIAAAREHGDDVHGLQGRERTLTLDLFCAVTVPRLTFEVFGPGSTSTGGKR